MNKKRGNRTKNGTLSKEENNREVRQVIFYRLASGREPVREWLRQLDPATRSRIGKDLYKLQLGWPVGMPLARKIDAGLWELRSKIPRGIVRIMFTEEKGQLILLHGFIKKAQKTHATDLTLVRRRLTNVKKGRNS